MPSYETLDAIADAYIPALALIALGFLVFSLIKSQWLLAGVKLAALVHLAIVSYGLMWIDNQFHIWPAFGLDYSTHTALALGLVVTLCFNSPKFMLLWLASLVCYVSLMLYQRYHTLADILTTGLAVGLLVLPVMICLYRFRPVRRMG